MRSEEDSVPILELDEEAARDTAAPVDAEPRKRLKPEQLWDWQALKVDKLKGSQQAWAGIPGFDHAALAREIDIELQIADVIAFVIDNERDIREFVDERRQEREAQERADKKRKQDWAIRRSKEKRA